MAQVCYAFSMSIAKKRANRNFNEIPRSTTRSWNKSGLGRCARRVRRYERKVGNRYEAALHWASFDEAEEKIEAPDAFAPPAPFDAVSFYDLFEDRSKTRSLLTDLCAYDDDFARLDVYDDDLYDVPDRAPYFEYLFGDL